MLHVQPRSRMSGVNRRHQLLEAALEVFSRKGFEGTTTKEVASHAGVTEAIIFRHFPTKQALYNAVLDYRAQSPEFLEWLDRFKACMERNDDEELLRSLARAILKDYREQPGFERVLLFAALEGHELGLAHNRQLVAPVYEMFRDYFERRRREGALGDLDPSVVIAAIVGMAKHYGMMTQMFGYHSESSTDDEVIESFVHIMMHGIRPAAPAGEM